MPEHQYSDDSIGPVVWVLTQRELEEMLEQVRTAHEVVMDLETTGLNEHAYTGGEANGGVAARISMAALTLPQMDSYGEWDGVEPTTYIVPLSHKMSPARGVWRARMRAIAESMVESGRPFVNQNVKFDARWVYACTGVSLARLIAWDTRVAAHLLDENQTTALKDVAPRVFNIPRWDDDVDFRTPGAAEETDLFTLGDYAARDTYWVWRLAAYQRHRMFLEVGDGAPPRGADEEQDARLGLLASRVSMPTVAALTAMEERGFLLDVPWVRSRIEELEREREDAFDEYLVRYPGLGITRDDISMAANAKTFLAWTGAAVEAGDLRVTATTPTGQPQWSKAVLNRQARAGSRAAELILRARAAVKSLEFLRSWLEKSSREGTIHASYNVGRVSTGRLSSSDPNMQQVAKALRPAFIPRDGYYIADLDYSQIELRVAAFLSRSEPMMEAYRSGLDLHSIIASQVSGKPLEEITPGDRQAGKAANFGLLYGQGPDGFRTYAADSYGVELGAEDSLRLYNTFFETWDGMGRWQEAQKALAMQNGEVVSPLGRVRRLPHIWSNGYQRGEAERQALNSPVQGFASDLMQIATASISGMLHGVAPVAGAIPVATVHDSIVVEVEQDGWQDIVRQCQARMRDLDSHLARFGVDLDVPLVAEASVGTRWGLSDVGEL